MLQLLKAVIKICFFRFLMTDFLRYKNMMEILIQSGISQPGILRSHHTVCHNAHLIVSIQRTDNLQCMCDYIMPLSQLLLIDILKGDAIIRNTELTKQLSKPCVNHCFP